MANKMLIDATHPEETRVVVVRGNRVEEFDFESAAKKQLRGNIYLAKVTRVEPSLQAAFVDYGGNRHGFLAFSEIHPDYYQIPQADRAALMEDERRAQADLEREESRRAKPARAETGEETESEADDGDEDGDEDDQVESVGAEDALEELPERRSAPRYRRQYKIQEVIKRRQVLLVQVVKEERGNKGAALTTYLSLAGRYSVLMPNTARGGGISRKITNVTDRKRLKKIAQELEVPEGMGVILRTAGAARTKVEVKRDFEYLMRLWENVRDLTLKSSAPTLVYEEGSLIKRSIRDLYNKDIDSVTVAGDEGYREAKDFMRMLMPSHAKNVQPYKELVPLFTRFGVESQLDAMFSPQVTLRSGGYIVINQTEALVSIDVNSGKSTREHNIEDTALQTNLEAAEEVSRQLRLRDLAGLIVIDFIDMEENRNNRAVERKIKECLKNDRARIQVGRISHFGLLEMSRQRLRTGVVESSMVTCPHCGGAGHVRSTESVALHILRALEEQLIRNSSHNLIVKTRAQVALYILNQKRPHLIDIENRFVLSISVVADEHAVSGSQLYVIERGEPVLRAPGTVIPALSATPVAVEPEEDDYVEEPFDEEMEAEEDDGAEAAPRGEPREAAEGEAGGERGERRKRRRRRRRRGGDGARGEGNGSGRDEFDADGRDGGGDDGDLDGDDAGDEGGDDGEDGGNAAALEQNGETRKKRRRGRRGGRRGRRGRDEDGQIRAGDGEDGGDDGYDGGDDAGEASDFATGDEADAAGGETVAAAATVADEEPQVIIVDRASLEADLAAVEEEKPAKKPRRSRAKPKAEAAAEASEGDSVEAAEAVPAKPRRTRAKRAAKPVEPVEAEVTQADVTAPVAEVAPVVAAPAESEAVTAPPVMDVDPGEDATNARPLDAQVAPPPPEEVKIEVSGGDDDGSPKRLGWWSRFRK